MWNPISTIIPRYIKNRGIDRKLQEQEICTLWDVIVEEIYRGASKFARPRAVKENVLYVTVCDPLWVTELEGNKHTLLYSLRRKCPHLTGILFQYLP